MLATLLQSCERHSGFIDAVTDRIMTGLAEFDEADRHKVNIVFSAHSVPMKVVEKGDHYVPEVAASVKATMEKVAARIQAEQPGATVPRHILAWQSKVCPDALSTSK